MSVTYSRSALPVRPPASLETEKTDALVEDRVERARAVSQLLRRLARIVEGVPPGKVRAQVRAVESRMDARHGPERHRKELDGDPGERYEPRTDPERGGDLRHPLAIREVVAAEDVPASRGAALHRRHDAARDVVDVRDADAAGPDAHSPRAADRAHDVVSPIRVAE